MNYVAMYQICQGQCTDATIWCHCDGNETEDMFIWLTCLSHVAFGGDVELNPGPLKRVMTHPRLLKNESEAIISENRVDSD